MMDFYEKSEGIPHYINMMEEAKAQAQHANLPSRDDVLVATDNQSMVATNNCPDKIKI